MVGKRQKGNIDLVTHKKCELKKCERGSSISFISIIISESAFLTISNTEQNMPETDINCSESFIYDKNEIT